MPNTTAIANYPERCAAAFAAGQLISLPNGDNDGGPLILAAAGEAAFAAEAAQGLLEPSAPFPVLTHRAYALPALAGPNSQIIALSESGKEPETVYTMADAAEKGAPLAVITGGGHLWDIAEAQSLPCVLLPQTWDTEGQCSLRLLFALWGLLGAGGRLPDGWQAEGEAAIAALRRQQTLLSAPDSPARQVAEALDGAVPLFLGSPGPLAAVARRWAFAWNALARRPAFAADALDWEYAAHPAFRDAATDPAPYALVWLRDRADSPLASGRIDALGRELAEAQPDLPQHEIFADGPNALTRLATATYLGDAAAILASE